MSKIEVNEIDKQSGSTLTIGGSGTTVQLGTGASQTGFGATGGISWQTAIKTTDFTAVSGEGYFVNTSGGSDITVTLPASPSAGNVVAIKDYARTFGTNKVIMARNGSNMDGTAGNTNLETDGLSVTFVFMDSTKGWSLINEDTTTQLAAAFVAATGGNTVATCGDFKIHTFTSPGTFCVSCAGNSGGSNTVSYMVIAGGGGGGSVSPANIGGGGGGAGGYREGLGLNDSYTGSPLRAPTGVPVTATGFPITVGAGGAGGPGTNKGVNGSNSIFSTIISAGGGFGGGGSAAPTPTNQFGGGPGGSGGGMSFEPGSIGAGNTPPVSPPQGQNGGQATEQPPAGTAPYKGSAGGGGAGGVGEPGQGGGPGPGTFNGGVGGAGVTSSINNTPTVRASGGSGGTYKNPSASPAATPGGGGAGGPGNGGGGSAGTANTGGGGGGAGTGNPGPGGTGGAGGSGIVIIRYKFQ